MPIAPVGADVAPPASGMLAASHRASAQAGGLATFGRWFAQQLAANQTAPRTGTTSPVSAASAFSPSGSGSQASMEPNANLSCNSAFSAEAGSEARKADEPGNDVEQDAELSAASAPAQDAVTQGPGDAAQPSGRLTDEASTRPVETGVLARPVASSASPSSAAPAQEAAPPHSSRIHFGPPSASAAASPSTRPFAHVVTNAQAMPSTDSTTSPLPARPVSIDVSAADSLRTDSAAVAVPNPVAPARTVAPSDAGAQPPALSTAPPSAVQAVRPAAAAETADQFQPASTHTETSFAGEAVWHPPAHGVAATASPIAPLGCAVTVAHSQSFSFAVPGASASVAFGITPPPATPWSVTTPHSVVSAADAHPSVTAESAAHAGNAFERMDTLGAPQVLAGTPQRLSVGVRDPGLGWVEIHTRTSAGEVSAALATPSAAIHTAISAQLPAIRDYLSGEQVRVDHLTSEQFGASSGGRENSSGNQPQAKDSRDAPARAIQSSLAEQSSESEGQCLSWIDVRV